MPNPEEPRKPSLKDRVRDLVNDILEALDALFPAPPPAMVPVPARGRRRR